MSTTNPMLTPREAARLIGVSYPSDLHRKTSPKEIGDFGL